MSYLDSMIERCNTLIDGEATQQQIDSCAEEIISAFSNDIPHIANYRGMRIIENNGRGHHSVDGLKQLRGKLLNLQEKRELESGADMGTHAVSEAILRCKTALSEELGDDEMGIIVDEMNSTFRAAVPGFSEGLSIYFPFDQDDQGNVIHHHKKDLKRISLKLQAYKDSLIREGMAKQNAGANVTMTNSNANSNTVSVAVTLTQTINAIDELPPSSLSDEEKLVLKGMLLEIEQSKDKSDVAKGGKVSKLLSWLSEHGLDIVKIVLPFVLRALSA